MAPLLASIEARAERALIRFDGEPAGQFIAAGAAEFGLGTVPSPDGLRIVSEPGTREVPISILGVSRWPDDSVMSIRLAFPVDLGASAETQYWLDWGNAGHTLAFDYAPGGGPPPVAFHVSTAPEDTQVSLDVPVGQLSVRLDDSRSFLRDYWYLIPTILIVAIVAYRRWRSG